MQKLLLSIYDLCARGEKLCYCSVYLQGLVKKEKKTSEVHQPEQKAKKGAKTSDLLQDLDSHLWQPGVEDC